MANGTSISGATSSVEPIGGEFDFTKNLPAFGERQKPTQFGAVAPIAPVALKAQQGPAVATQAIGPILSGIGAAEGIVPTTEASDAITQALISGATGAASGALTGAAGGPIGAVGGAIIGGVTGLVAGGVKAYFGLKAARKQERAQKRLVAKAEKQRRQDIARDEKWRNVNRLDSLQAAKFNRNQSILQNKWASFQATDGSERASCENEPMNLYDIKSLAITPSRQGRVRHP